MRQLAPEDSTVIDEYINGIKSFITDTDWFGINNFGSIKEKLSLVPFFITRAKYFKYTLESFAKRFKNPLLRKAFPFIRNSLQGFPLFGYLAEHAACIYGDMGWPKGGSSTP